MAYRMILVPTGIYSWMLRISITLACVVFAVFTMVIVYDDYSREPKDRMSVSDRCMVLLGAILPIMLAIMAWMLF